MIRIGVDFDNTIISYDEIFHKIAKEKNLIPDDLPANKGAVRDYLRKQDQEDIWTEMQGYVYGKRLIEADPFPGVFEFFFHCKKMQLPVFIVSHKTIYPYAGEKYNLHQAAREWLEKKGFLTEKGIGLTDQEIFFELSKTEKIERIIQLNCTHFIDDLPEFLSELKERKRLNQIIFDPWNKHSGYQEAMHAGSWQDILSTFQAYTNQ